MASTLGAGTDPYLRVDGAEPLSPELVARVEALSERAEQAPPGSIVVLHLTGADTDPQWPGATGVHLVNKWERALRRLERLTVATIAIAEGNCGGPAAEALLSTDYRLATPDLRLRIPARHGAVWPGMILHRLANQIGVARVRQMALFGADLTAEEVMRLSLVDGIVDDLDEAVTVARGVVGGAAGSELAIRRRLLLEATTNSFEEALGTHLAACDRALRKSADAAAG